MKKYHRTLFSLAAICLTLSLLGPFTYADDLRHLGEISVVIGFFIAGMFLLSPLFFETWQYRNAMPWVTPFVFLGLLIGTILEQALLGLIITTGTGIFILFTAFHLNNKTHGKD